MDRTAKTLTLALAVSLALNLFFVGFAVGRRSGFFRGRMGPHVERMERGPHGGHGGMELGPRGFLRRAGLADAGPEVASVIESRRGALREQRAKVRRARTAVAEALAAEPFDAQRFSASLSALHTESARVQTEMHAAFVELARTLSPEQRKRMAQAPWFLHDPPGPPH